MKDYTFELSRESLNLILDEANLVTFKGGFKLVGASNWFKLIEDMIILKEGAEFNLKDQLLMSQTRYYPDSKRALNFLVLYLKCKKCNDLNYIVKLVSLFIHYYLF